MAWDFLSIQSISNYRMRTNISIIIAVFNLSHRRNRMKEEILEASERGSRRKEVANRRYS